MIVGWVLEHHGIRSQLAKLLETEALEPVAQSPKGEAYGEYLDDLVDLVLGFRDPSADRGLALLGIQTLKGSQDYLAEQGAAALPALDEAWQRVACARDPVLETLGRMLAAAPTNQLTPTQVQGVLRRLLERSDSAPTGFLWGADYASLSDAVPIIQALLAKDPYPDIEQALVNRLAARRDGTSPADLLSHLRLWTAGFCTDAAGPRRGVCESMDNLLADAEQQLKAGRTGPARNTLDARGKTRGRGADTGGIESDGGASDHGERPLPEEPVVIAALRAWAFGPRRRLAFGDPASGRPSTRANARAKEVLRHC